MSKSNMTMVPGPIEAAQFIQNWLGLGPSTTNTILKAMLEASKLSGVNKGPITSSLGFCGGVHSMTVEWNYNPIVTCTVTVYKVIPNYEVDDEKWETEEHHIIIPIRD